MLGVRGSDGGSGVQTHPVYAFTWGVLHSAELAESGLSNGRIFGYEPVAVVIAAPPRGPAGGGTKVKEFLGKYHARGIGDGRGRRTWWRRAEQSNIH